MENLDCLSTNPQDLWTWYNAHAHGQNARQLFPDRPKGYRRATADLAHYAANKATAMQCRARGNVQLALRYEAICERIYNTLPEFARW